MSAPKQERSLAPDDWAEIVRLMLGSGTHLDVVVESVRVSGSRWWGLVALVDREERLVLGRAREFKAERKLWRQFEYLAKYLESTLPDLDTITVRLKE